MKILGTVVALDMNATIKKKAGGTYPGVRLTYRDKDEELKEETMHENGIKYNAELGAGIKSLEVDDKFTMVKEKEGDFWNVKDLYKGHDAAASNATKPTSSGNTSSKAASSSGGGGNSTYPTADERAKTQCQIVRQSSLGHAVNLTNAIGNKKATPADIIAIAQQFEQYVHLGKLREPGEDSPDDEDDIPF